MMYLNVCPKVQYTNKKGTMETKEASNKLIDKFQVFASRGGELSVGLSAKYLSDRAFDYFLYPFVIFKFGIIKGGIVMTILAFILNIATIIFYDWSKRDWLGIESIKNLKNYTGNKMIVRFTSWLLKRSNPVIFLFLSIQYDAFTATVYLRQGKFNGMKGRDWSVFFGSLFLSNAYWTLASFMGISLVKWVWKAAAG